MAMLPFLQEKGLPRVVPCLGLFGANGSGKSTVMEAFALLQSIIARGLPGQPYKPNRLAETIAKPTSFELEFFFRGYTNKYYLAYNQNRIIEEHLITNEAMVFSYSENNHAFHALTTSVYTLEKLEEIFSVQAGFQQSFLKVLALGFSGLSKEVTSAFSYIANHITILTKEQASASQFFTNYQHIAGESTDFGPLVRLLNMFDIDIVHIEKRQGFEETLIAYHPNREGAEIAFDLTEESEGTQRLFRVLDTALDRLAIGGVAIIDYLDLLLHPRLSIELVRMFKSKRLNTKGAQLVFSANSTELLADELLRVSEIGIISKTLDGGTAIKRVSSFSGQDYAHDFRDNYLNNRYGGVPFPHL